MLKYSKFINYFYIVRQEITDHLVEIFSLVYVRLYLVVVLVLNMLNWLAVFYIDKKITDQQIALHYNVDFGINYYGDISNIYTIPVLGFLIIFINFLLSTIMVKQPDHKFIYHILFITSGIANLVLLISLITIFMVNY